MAVARVILDGKAIAEKIRAEAAAGARKFRERHGRAPGLHVLLAGENPASAVYVRNKDKAAKDAGFAGEVHRLPETITLGELLARTSAIELAGPVLMTGWPEWGTLSVPTVLEPA